MNTLTQTKVRATTAMILGVALAWGIAVVFGAETGFFAKQYQPSIAAIVAATIIVPTLVYFMSLRLKAYADAIGHRPIMLFHTWRVPAALVFFWCKRRQETTALSA